MFLWKCSDNVYHGYAFLYDKAGRLRDARYGEGSTRGSNTGRYDVSLEYDRMGNITSLIRRGLQDDGVYGSVDNLVTAMKGTCSGVSPMPWSVRSTAVRSISATASTKTWSMNTTGTVIW